MGVSFENLSIGTYSYDIGSRYVEPWSGWVSPQYGDDSMARWGDNTRPFKTLNAAVAAAPVYSATVNPPIIYVIEHPPISAGNKINVGDITIDKPLSIIGMNFFCNNNNAAFVDGTFIIDSSIEQPIHICNLIFYNPSVDKPCIDIRKLSAHGVTFITCYIRPGIGSKTAVVTSGQATVNANSSAMLLRFLNCTFFGKAIFGMGTDGNPFDKRGMALISGPTRVSSPSAYGTALQIDRGYIKIANATEVPPVTLNGGALALINSTFAWPGASNNAIVASDVASIGNSFLFVHDCDMYSGIAVPASQNKIVIGDKVVYSIKNTQLKLADLSISPGAQEFNTYLGADAKVVYNSGPVYGAGTALT